MAFNPLPVSLPPIRPAMKLFVWGAGDSGQLGLGPDALTELDKPTRHTWAEQQIENGSFGEPGAGIEQIAAGGLHSLFIDEIGTIWSCGSNDDAALGRITENIPDPNNPGSYLDRDDLISVPHPLQTLVDEGFRAVKVAAGDNICAAVSDQGQLRVWGSFRINQGPLGFSKDLNHQPIPIPMLNDLLIRRPGNIENVSDIAAGDNHLVVLTTHGNIFTWGAGQEGQLGRKTIERRIIHGTVPEKVILGSRTRKAVIIGAGSFHSFAVDDSGDVWGWGLNFTGQTGTGFETSGDSMVYSPRRVRCLSNAELQGDTVQQIAAGLHHSLFLTTSGKVYAVGRCDAGQIGLSEDHSALRNRSKADFISEPVRVEFPDANDPVVHISVGSHNNLAVTQDGALYCWGQGMQGELGVSEEEVKTPRMIVRRQGGSWAAVKVSCGGQHSLGLFRRR